jgi:hypothetical protein
MGWQDPIVADVRKARDAYAKQSNYALDAIYHDLKAKECQSGRRVIPCPSKREKTPDQQGTAKLAELPRAGDRLQRRLTCGDWVCRDKPAPYAGVQVADSEGRATHAGPESCTSFGNGAVQR